MKTIVITSQKGGSAKTTLTALLSVQVEAAGDGPAWIIDTDQQNSLARWHERREYDKPQRAVLPFRELATGLDALAAKHKAKFCFIDTAPTVSNQSAALIALADLVIIPVQPSPCDLWSAAETIELVKAAAKPFRFVITKANPRAALTAQTVAALSHYGPVAETFIRDRTAYAAAMASGSTAPEMQPRGLAALETEALWQEIKRAFQHSSKSAKKVMHHG